MWYEREIFHKWNAGEMFFPIVIFMAYLKWPGNFVLFIAIYFVHYVHGPLSIPSIGLSLLDIFVLWPLCWTEHTLQP